MRKIVIFILIASLFCLSGCGFNEASKSTSSSPTENTGEAKASNEVSKNIPSSPTKGIDNGKHSDYEFKGDKITIKEIEKIINLKKDDIDKILGVGEIDPSGGEGDPGYIYKYDINIYYNNKGVNYIECGNTVDIKGAHSGMNFNEISNFLGEGKKSTWSPEEHEDYVVYCLKYVINNHTYQFTSESENGSDSTLTIFSKNNI